jgi:hypothetical protein
MNATDPPKKNLVSLNINLTSGVIVYLMTLVALSYGIRRRQFSNLKLRLNLDNTYTSTSDGTSSGQHHDDHIVISRLNCFGTVIPNNSQISTIVSEKKPDFYIGF